MYLQVEEVKTWFEERLKPSKVLLILEKIHMIIINFCLLWLFFLFPPLYNLYPFRNCYSLIPVDLQNYI
jgi:hypothetical protein